MIGINMDELIGKTITSIRYLDKEELDNMDWYGKVPVIIFDDGTEIIASQDSEGNGPGVFFVVKPE